MLRPNVCPLLMVSTVNAGVPVALTFVPVENSELYDKFYTIFEKLHQIQLNQYLVVAGQGSSIQSMCERYD
jgi:hypothetical protein